MASEHYTVRIQEGADPEAVARRLFDSVPGFQGFYPMMNQSIGDSILKRYYVAEFWTDDVEATRRKIFQVSGVEIAYPKPDGGAPADHEASLVRGAKKLMAFKLIADPDGSNVSDIDAMRTEDPVGYGEVLDLVNAVVMAYIDSQKP